jgi:SagB-type dehydrogenase family enzyme
MPTVNVRLSLPEDSLCELLHTETKLTPCQHRQWQHQPPPVSEHPAIVQWMRAPYKEYLSLPQIALPPPASAPTGRLDPACIAALLQQPAEIISLECYLAATELDRIAPGMHHYNKRTHSLETFPASAAPAQPLRQQMPENLAGLLLVTGVLTRMRLKHGERGYRYMLFEAGQVQERMRATAAALHLRLELLPDFYDDAVNELLGVDGVEESALFLAALRRPET